MTKKPFLNALIASCYVILVSLIPTFGDRLEFVVTPKIAMIAPILFLSIFTLSAAVMALLFFYQPVVLLIEGNKVGAFKMLIETILSFAVTTLSLFLIALLFSFI